MQVIAADEALVRARRVAVARSALVAVLLLAAGASLAWLCLGTPLVASFFPYGRPTPLETALGILVWGFALLIPALFVIMGFTRLLGTLDEIGSLQHHAVVPDLRSGLGADYLAVTDLPLPGGGPIPELVLGPFGIVVLGTVPPPSVARRAGSRWEMRDGRGRWLPWEGPLERTTRDADRVRRWLFVGEHEFTARIYAAVVTGDQQLERTAACAVVAPRDLVEWVQALPFQRGLTPDRRAQLVEQIRLVIAS